MSARKKVRIGTVNVSGRTQCACILHWFVVRRPRSKPRPPDLPSLLFLRQHYANEEAPSNPFWRFFVNFHLARFVAWLIYLLQLFLKAFRPRLGQNCGHGRRGSFWWDGEAAVGGGGRGEGVRGDTASWPVIFPRL